MEGCGAPCQCSAPACYRTVPGQGCNKRPDTLLEITRYFHVRWRALAHEVLLANLEISFHCTAIKSWVDAATVNIRVEQ